MRRLEGISYTHKKTLRSSVPLKKQFLINLDVLMHSFGILLHSDYFVTRMQKWMEDKKEIISNEIISRCKHVERSQILHISNIYSTMQFLY